jgi:beta-mannanase
MSDRRSSSRRKRPEGRTKLRVWAAVNVAVLLTCTGWVLHDVGSSHAAPVAVQNAATPSASASVSASASSSASASASASATRTASFPTKAQILASTGSTTSAKYFGVSAVNLPWSATAMRALAAKTGTAPDMVEYYVNWTQRFDQSAVFDAYAENALPVITWEPFAGLTGSQSGNVSQSSYSLSTIIDGSHDAYITAYAAAVKAVKAPVVIRFAHEMDGSWYPWSEGYNGNTTGQYAQAWRHVWTLFEQAGATNVIWDWAPNILRGASNTDLQELYPGDQYVDWAGVTGYDDTESTAATLFDTTVNQIRAFTAKPLLISETGSQPGGQKAAFTADLLSWLPRHSDIIGFIWNETTKAQGSGADWGFDADSATLASFQSGIKSLTLVKISAVVK